MSVPPQPLAELTSRAIAILIRELGPADMIRFLGQFTNGFGDYTAERDDLIGPITLDEILAEIRGTAGGLGEQPRG